MDNRLELEGNNPTKNSDEWLMMKVKAALQFPRNVNAENTQVYVSDGVVTLRGEAAKEAQKELSGKYANVEGVRGVKNEMTVAKVPKSEERTRKENVDDAAITAQVKLALLRDRATSALKTSVMTKDRIVTLTGNVDTLEERDRVLKLASEIRGVTHLVNDITIN